MATKKLTISKIKMILECLIILGSEKLPFVFEFNKSVLKLEKAIEEWEKELTKIKESFFEEMPKDKKVKLKAGEKEQKNYKKYLFEKDGKNIKAIRDKEGKLIDYLEGDLLPKGQFAFSCVNDDKIEAFNLEYNKLLNEPIEVSVHQIEEDRFNEALNERFAKKGESVDANIVKALQGIIIVEEIEE